MIAAKRGSGRAIGEARAKKGETLDLPNANGIVPLQDDPAGGVMVSQPAIGTVYADQRLRARQPMSISFQSAPAKDIQGLPVGTVSTSETRISWGLEFSPM